MKAFIRLFLALFLSLPIVTSLPAMEAGIPTHAVILMYHHVGEDRFPSTSVSVAQFEAHLDFLKREGFHVWSLAKIVDVLRRGDPIPDKVVAITFDDGYRSVYLKAYPRLAARGWPFTVFVSTDYIDRRFSAYMTWDEMREMESHGASFANHSTSHAHLVRRAGEDAAVWEQRIRRDILHASTRLQEELQNVQMFFSYPYGEYSLELADVIASLGFVGFGQESGPVGVTSDFRFLPRFPLAGAYAELDAFRFRVWSLPFQILDIEPKDPLTRTTRPVLRLSLVLPKGANVRQLRCYASDQGEIRVSPVSEQPAVFEVQALDPLPAGRSRYNCTMSSRYPGRYYWYSHPWLRDPGQGD